MPPVVSVPPPPAGRWLVRFPSGAFSRPEILTILRDVERLLPPLAAEPTRRVELELRRGPGTDACWSVPGGWRIRLHDRSPRQLPLADGAPPPADLRLPPLPIDHVTLAFPAVRGDARLESVGFPAALLFLSSVLRRSGRRVSTLQPHLPLAGPLPAVPGGMFGCTVFEDQLPAAADYLRGVRASFSGLTAAGGPFVTLAPTAALVHLPAVELFVRGEGEIVLPAVLDALATGDVEALWRLSGVWLWRDEVLVAAGFQEINHPEDLSGLSFSLEAVPREALRRGLEINFSRGCRRGCLFCSKTMGRILRRLPPNAVEQLLDAYDRELAAAGESTAIGRTVNINDDDILQDGEYAAAVFAILKRRGFRLWGIQTSPASLLTQDGRLADDRLALCADSALFVEDHPLVWLGSDAFLPERGRRLAKPLPPPALFEELLSALERRAVRHFHYWISSDYASSWPEFVAEVLYILGLRRRFPLFGLLPHAPFLVPYPSTPLHRLLRQGGLDAAVRCRAVLRAGGEFDYPLVERVETPWEQLNRLLRNERVHGAPGFFDHLRAGDDFQALLVVYHFLKQERLAAVSRATAQELAEWEDRLAEALGGYGARSE